MRNLNTTSRPTTSGKEAVVATWRCVADMCDKLPDLPALPEDKKPHPGPGTRGMFDLSRYQRRQYAAMWEAGFSGFRGYEFSKYRGTYPPKGKSLSEEEAIRLVAEGAQLKYASCCCFFCFDMGQQAPGADPSAEELLQLEERFGVKPESFYDLY